jgi:TetR/AcrR family transcriptional repressor of nem operon
MAGRPRAFDSRQVLDRALALFWRNGYAGTGLSELEAATGLGRQSLYGAFGDKRAFFVSVVDHYVESVLRPGLRDVLEAPGSPRAQLERLFGLWEEAAAAPDFQGCLVGNCVAEMSGRDAALGRVLAAQLELMEGWIRHALERARSAGEVPAQLDVHGVARAILVLSQGLSVVARVRRDPAFFRSVARSAARLLDGP